MEGVALLFCGIPGSGKTAVAGKVAAKLKKAFHVQTDVLRHMIPAPSYGYEESRMVYEMLAEIARIALTRGHTVIMDGTFSKEEHRRKALEALGPACKRHLIIWIESDLDTALARNKRRTAAVPEGRLREIYIRFEPPSPCFRVNTALMSEDQAASEILAQLKKSSLI